MVGNLNELNRLLISLRELNSDKQRVSVSLLKRHLRLRVFLGSNPAFEPIVEFAVQLGLATLTHKGIALTHAGLALLAENPADFYELRPRQCALLVRKCYLDGALRSEMKLLRTKFEMDAENGPIIWSELDSEPLGETEWLIEHLVQLGVLTRGINSLAVKRTYRKTIAQFWDEGGDFTEEQLEKHLAEKRLLGDIAESFVLEFERDRLRMAGHAAEAVCVKQISKIRVNAGHDICSFDGKSSGLTHDRFIEVKGSGQPNVRFIWTPNEMEKAKALGDKYWIYFVGGIAKKHALVARSPILIQNPHKRLQGGSIFKLEPQSMLVQSNQAGAVLKPPVKIHKRNN